MNSTFGIGAAVALALAGCGGEPLIVRDGDPAFFAGAETSAESANGLAFADGTQAIADVETQAMSVKLLRFVTDYDTGETVLVVSDETVTVPVGFTDFSNRDVVMTIDGETFTFVSGRATDPAGRTFEAYTNFKLVHSGTGGFFTYASKNPSVTPGLDTEGFYSFGFETSPDAIDARTGEAVYAGSYAGYGQLLNPDGSLQAAEVQNIGVLNLSANFDSNNVVGRLIGRIDPSGDTEDYEMVFLSGPITGNGFVGGPDFVCPSGHSCASNSSIGGVFYGPDGAEISGVIGIDGSISGPDQNFRFVGASGFSGAE